MTFKERMYIKRVQNADFDLFVGTCIALIIFHIWKG